MQVSPSAALYLISLSSCKGSHMMLYILLYSFQLASKNLQTPQIFPGCRQGNLSLDVCPEIQSKVKSIILL